MKVHTLDLHFLHLDHAVAAFVVEGPDGLALVETGPYSTLPRLEAALTERGWRLDDFQHVFLSHIHFDHAGAAWALAERGAMIHVHPRGLPHLAAPEKLYASARQIYGDRMEELWGEMRPIPIERLHAPEHGETGEAAGLRFTAWYTPGHAVHHVAWEASPLPPPEEGELIGVGAAIFTGDVAGVFIDGGPVMPPCPPPDIQVEDWLDSIRLLRERPTQTLYLTHFGPAADKQAHLDELERRLREWAEWMRPYAEQNTPAETILPRFREYVEGQLTEAGLNAAQRERYEAANPSFMSVAGLLRYWHKKHPAAAQRP